MNHPNHKPKLNLNQSNVKPKVPTTDKEMAETVADFYNTMGNCLVNLVAIHENIAKTLEETSIDSSDIAFYLKKIALSNGWVDEIEVEEREKEGDEEPPANSEGFSNDGG